MPGYKEVTQLGLDPADVDQRVQQTLLDKRRRAARLWGYYRNPMTETCSTGNASRPYRLFQEWGMPLRITGYTAGSEFGLGTPSSTVARKETTCQNEIGWRIDTKVEYLVGKPILLRSAALGTDQRQRELTTVMRGMLSGAGGNVLLQQICTLAHIHGFADIQARLENTPATAEHWLPPRIRPDKHSGSPNSWADLGSEPDESVNDEVEPNHRAKLRSLGSFVRAHLIEPSQAMPFLDPNDWRVTRAYGTVTTTLGAAPSDPEGRPWWQRLMALTDNNRAPQRPNTITVDLIGPTHWQRYTNGNLTASGTNGLGELPIAHLNLAAEPFTYHGPGDVEPLIPLQDELNIRLSDRSQRVTMQSFQMYLGKGIENFNQLPVGPGRMWSTDNLQASIETFGGDQDAPSETAHIADTLEAMDKLSRVSPVAAGAIKGKVGNLTSAAALRLTLVALLSETVRKRGPLGAAIQRFVELGFMLLDKSGQFHTKPDERRIELAWPSPLPENLTEALSQAQEKINIGVPASIVLAELGYDTSGQTPAERQANHGQNAPTGNAAHPGNVPHIVPGQGQRPNAPAGSASAAATA